MAIEVIDKFFDFIRKSLSMIIAMFMAIGVVVYIIGSGIVISSDKSIANIGFTHVIGIIVSVLTTVTYLALHFLPRKGYRMLYILTGLLIVSIFFCSHSLGLAMPTVSDCDKKDLMFVVVKGKKGPKAKYKTVGLLGQEVTTCSGNNVLLAGSLIVVLTMMAAIFDVQKTLLSRVKSKTYGERFVEMGISY